MFEILKPAPPSEASDLDWRERLLQGYVREGFVVHEVVATPPRRPTREIGTLTAGVYEHVTEVLDWSSPKDEAAADAYVERTRMLRERFGSDNVRTVYPTPLMEAVGTGYTMGSHVLPMVNHWRARVE